MLTDGLDASSIEPRHQMGDGIAALPTRLACRTLEAHARGNGEQLSCPDHLGGWISPGATQLFEVTAFIRREGTKRILLVTGHGSSWHHDSESAIPAPYVVFCATFAGTSYEGFDHEADVVLGYLASLVDAGLPEDLAREGLRAYHPLWSDLFSAGWEQACPKGFPDVELDPQYDLTLPFSGAFLHQAADLHIPGIGHGAGSPASGDFMIVADTERLDELRRQMQGQYVIYEVAKSDYWGGPFGIPLERIEQARTG